MTATNQAASATFDFSGRHVLVTGATSGIGSGIAEAFLAAGAHVTITGTRDSAADYDDDLSAYDYRQLVLADPDQIIGLAASLEGLDILVNNAGASLPGGRNEHEPDVFAESVEINLVGAFRLASAAKDILAAGDLDGGSSVIGLASMASYFGVPMVPGYGAAKAGIVQLTKALAVAWAGDGIRVNAVAPGLVESRMTEPLKDYPALAEPLISRTPMQRWGTPDDIAPAVLFLASSAARYITGQTLAVDGGYSAA